MNSLRLFRDKDKRYKHNFHVAVSLNRHLCDKLANFGLILKIYHATVSRPSRDIHESVSRLSRECNLLCLPPTGSGDILFFPVRLSVCLSVRHKSCLLYNLKTVKDFSMKFGTLVNHDKTMCHAQEP